MQKERSRFTILYLMGLTSFGALGCATLFNESPWLRGSLMTIILALILKSMIGTAIYRGSRQAFAIGYTISTFFYILSLYTLAGIETLPLLITQYAWDALENYSFSLPDEDHFLLVSVLLWGMLCTYSGALASEYWYRRRIQEVEQEPSRAGRLARSTPTVPATGERTTDLP
ncbi:hypothetical protein Q31a_31660 [Aureliella helgolandensis]|uniref:Uncharacterized protein n=2 Tax=Aureliella helgolandensis TaxID=2527968 RepID=A0A518G8D3_9BACT|nr:hypothetical protein Q31a_31660 [Aureliella helgolandensis]